MFGPLVSDVLAFYQERIVNEGFLRTATERRSILELARAIGYELKPGVAATTFLAFTVDDANGTLEKTVISQGTKVQSIPDQGEIPQTFETTEELEARQEWNELKPKLTMPQSIRQGGANDGVFYFNGTNTRLKVGDSLLVVDVKDNKAMPQTFNIVANVREEPEFQRTRVQIIRLDKINPPVVLADPGVSEMAAAAAVTSPFETKAGVGSKMLKEIGSAMWTESDLLAFAEERNISRKDMDITINFAASRAASTAAATAAATSAGTVEPRVYVLRKRAAHFGHNDPKYKSGNAQIPGGDTIYLDNTYSDVIPSSSAQDSWAVLQSAAHSGKWAVYRINRTVEETKFFPSLGGLGIKVTGLIFEPNEGEVPISDFIIPQITIFVKSEQLELAEMPDEEPIGGSGGNGSIAILGRKVSYLHPGQIVAITGMLVDEEDETVPLGLVVSEIAVIHKVGGDGYCTRLAFSKNLVNKYKRDTVKINANVVRASHGETKSYVLGSGDPSHKQQSFSLKHSPLTYVSAPAAGGTKSTLELKVDDVLWDEAPSLYALGTGDQSYTVRIQDSGEANIIFGNGMRGKSPTAGIENIKVKYRVGIGRPGMLKMGQLSLLMDRPLGVRTVTNPLSPSGAEDPEKLIDARINAPLHVLTLERIVSLKDLEDFANAFAGIAKAQAVWIWDGEKRSIHLTVAAVDGKHVDENLYRNLDGAINSAKDPLIRVNVISFKSISFNVVANVAIAKNMDAELIREKIRKALLERFSFNSREFGQGVSISEVMVAIQGVEGVVSVDIDRLYKSKAGTKPETAPLETMIAANIAQQQQNHHGETKPAELLTINPEGIFIGVIKQ